MTVTTTKKLVVPAVGGDSSCAEARLVEKWFLIFVKSKDTNFLNAFFCHNFFKNHHLLLVIFCEMSEYRKHIRREIGTLMSRLM